MNQKSDFQTGKSQQEQLIKQNNLINKMKEFSWEELEQERFEFLTDEIIYESKDNKQQQ